MAATIKARKVSRSAQGNFAWFQAHESELSRRYQGEWVAVYRKKVVAHGRLDEVEAALDAEADGNAQYAIIAYMDDPLTCYGQTLV